MVCDEFEVLGCTDDTAFNFDSSATDDDGSCVPIIAGCMDGDAVNYNSNANTYDGSCCYISGCMDPVAFNYNPNACQDDGSCVPIIAGVQIQLHLITLIQQIPMMDHVFRLFMVVLTNNVELQFRGQHL